MSTTTARVENLTYAKAVERAGLSTIQLEAATTSTPEHFVAALTDFGLGRQKRFEDGTPG